jgi:low temperature requirement protein LtrA
LTPAAGAISSPFGYKGTMQASGDPEAMRRERSGRLPVAIHDWDDEARHATWLELFFDLVFVAALANLGDLLHDDHSFGGVLTVVGLLVPIWWAWISFSYFADLFDDDSPLHRSVQLAAMLGAIVLAVTLIDGVDADGHLFALTYSALFVLLAVMYALTGRSEPRAAELCRWYTVGSAVGAALWGVSAAVPPPGRYWVWGVALVANAAISGPIAYARMHRPPEQVSHMPERFGLFAIVVLGEAVVSVVQGVGATDWVAASTVTAVAGFVIAAGIWWVYFSGFDEAAINQAIAGGRQSEVRSFLYGYGHIIVYSAVVAIGVGVEIAIERAAAGGEPPALLGWATVMLIGGFFVVGWGRSVGVATDAAARWVRPVKVAVAVVAVVACSVDIPVPLATSLVALAWVGLVLAEMRLGLMPGWPGATAGDGH